MLPSSNILALVWLYQHFPFKPSFFATLRAHMNIIFHALCHKTKSISCIMFLFKNPCSCYTSKPLVLIPLVVLEVASGGTCGTPWCQLPGSKTINATRQAAKGSLAQQIQLQMCFCILGKVYLSSLISCSIINVHMIDIPLLCFFLKELWKEDHYCSHFTDMQLRRLRLKGSWASSWDLIISSVVSSLFA